MSSYTELPECWKTDLVTPQTLLEISEHLHGLGIYRTFDNGVSLSVSESKIDHVARFTKDIRLRPSILESRLNSHDLRGFDSEEAKEEHRKDILINYWSESIPSINNIPGLAKRKGRA